MTHMTDCWNKSRYLKPYGGQNAGKLKAIRKASRESLVALLINKQESRAGIRAA